jgi:sulfofructose kinase
MQVQVTAKAASQTHVLCVGAAALDTIFKVDQIPSGQGKILPTDMLQVAEGMAASAAYAVAQMGGRVTLWSAIGDDAAGAQIISELSDSGIDTGAMLTVPGARSALSTILVDDSGERLIVPFYDPKLHQQPKSFSDEELSGFDAVLVDVRWPALAYDVLTRAKALGVPAILDGDVAAVETLMHLGSAATHIVFSEPAAMALTSKTQGDVMLKSLRALFPETFLSVTFGEKGSYWMEATSNDVEYHTTLHVEAVDTLAPGDIFHGTFAQCIAEGLTTLETIRLSSAAAAIKCTKFGGRLGAPNRNEIEMAVHDWIGR